MPSRFINERALGLETQRISDLILRDAHPIGTPAPSPPVVVPPPATELELRPELFLAEYHRLSIFRGDIHRDELIASGPQLAPGASTKVVIATKIKTAEQRTQETCILDSRTSESSKLVNDRLETASDEKYGTERYDYNMRGHFHGEGSVGFGSAEADATVDVSGSTNDTRQEFASSVGRTLDEQVSTANSARREVAQTGSAGQFYESTQFSTFEAVVKNETNKTQNYGVFQVKEEVISVLSLVDVKLLFANGDKAAERQVSLYKAHELLGDVIADPETAKRILARIRSSLSQIRDKDEVPRSIVREDAGPVGFSVDKALTQEITLTDSRGQPRRKVSVPGIIMATYRHYIRKPGVTVLLPLVAA